VKYFSRRLLPFLFPALLAPVWQVHADEPIGTVNGIVTSTTDGSHITVNNNGTEIFVQLHCIDAPIITKIRRNEPWLSKPGQPYAGRAFMSLSNKVLHKQVRIDIMRMNHRHQAVAVVWVEGRNINLEMVTEGLAWADRKCKKRAADAEYLAAEEQARSRKTGLWAQENPRPPWEFRKIRKLNKESW
jgi:endonuclease YncB( thermonuclease family)